MDKNSIDKLLSKIYYDVSARGSFGGIDSLFRQSKKYNPQILKADVKKWLEKQEDYGVHFPFRKSVQTSRIIVKGINYMWKMDLMDMSSLARYNGGVKYVLLVIDDFSRYVWVAPLRSKSGDDVVSKIKGIFSIKKPIYVRTDKGKEFVNAKFQNFLKLQKVKHIVTQSEKKAAIAERAIKTIKSKLYKYMYNKQIHKYVDILQEVVKVYNSSYHTSIKMQPREVNKKNEESVWRNLYVNNNNFLIRYKNKKLKLLKIGDYVRISFLRQTFAREYRQKWSSEIFQIYKIFVRDGVPVYLLRDFGGEEIQGSFYREELQLTEYDEGAFYKIEKIIRRRRNVNSGKKEYLVKWLNWGKKYNSWVSESVIKRL